MTNQELEYFHAFMLKKLTKEIVHIENDSCLVVLSAMILCIITNDSPADHETGSYIFCLVNNLTSY